MQKGKKHNKEAKEKMRRSHLGVKFSEERKRKMSEAHKGLTHTQKTKFKLSKAKMGENNPNWRGGTYREKYGPGLTNELISSIRKRDGFACQECGICQDKLSGYFQFLDVHHIDYDKNNHDPQNLITLCHSCHMKTNFNRKDWCDYLRIKINV